MLPGISVSKNDQNSYVIIDNQLLGYKISSVFLARFGQDLFASLVAQIL